jgi:hypothetical protein
VIRGLPPGDYEVAFELQGMSPKTEKSVVELGRTTSVDAEMAIAAVAESINVMAESSPVVSNTVVGARRPKSMRFRMAARHSWSRSWRRG